MQKEGFTGGLGDGVPQQGPGVGDKVPQKLKVFVS